MKDARERDETVRAFEDVPDRGAGPLAAGTTIGRYVVIEELGAGGMASVVRAYDSKLRRNVALKMVRRDLVGAQGEVRLVQEAQAMARLSHPAVVTVHDVAATREGIVITMELVEGGTLARWIANEHGTDRILDVFLQAGRGLAAAHRAGVVHRDFKPTNVLMTEDGRPKVADFGIARCLAEAEVQFDLDDGTAPPEPGFTRTGLVIGTPRYMAPEQRETSHVDARADQYAFCVALWEALAGHAPFVAAMTGETDNPDDRRIATLPGASAAIAPVLARGLSARPEDRFADMDALLEALVLASGTRRRRRLAIVSVGALGLLAGLVAWGSRSAPVCDDGEALLASVWDEARASDLLRAMHSTGAPYAATMASRLRGQLDAYAQDWSARHRDVCEATRIRHERSTADMDVRMSCLFHAKAELGAVIDVLFELDRETLASAGNLVAQLPELSTCDDTQRLSAAAVPDPRTAAAVEALRVRLAHARTLGDAGRHADGLAEATAIATQATSYDDPVLASDVSLVLGRLYARAGEREAARDQLTTAMRSALAMDDTNRAITATSALAFHLADEEARPEPAHSLTLVALGLAARPETQPRVEADALSTHGGVLRILGRYDEAEASLRRSLEIRIATLGADHPHVATSRTNLGLALAELGRTQEAIAEHRQAAAIWLAAYGPEHPSVGLARGNLGNVLVTSGRVFDAVTELEAALAIREQTSPADDPHVGIAHNDLGIALESAGRYADAEAEAREAIRIWSVSLGPDNLRVGLGRNNLGIALEQQGRLHDAATEFQRAAAEVERAVGSDHPVLAKLWANSARTMHALGDDEQAEASYRRALAQVEAKLSPQHVQAASVLCGLADVLIARGRIDEAVAATSRASEIAGATAISPELAMEIATARARALWSAGRRR